MRFSLRILLTVLAFQMYSISSAQIQLHLRSGFSINSFLFQNSAQEFTGGYKYKVGNYTALGVDIHFKKLHTFRTALGYRQTGASTFIEKTRIAYDFQYVDLSAAYLISCYTNDRVKLYLGAEFNLGILARAEQQTGTDIYDLRADRSLRDIDFTPNLVFGTKIKVVEPLYFGIEYRFGISATNIESDVQKPTQVTRNMAHNILFGLSFTLPKKPQTENQPNQK